MNPIIQLDKGRRGRYAESPPFTYTISSGLAANARYVKSYQDEDVEEEKKYIPFNYITIENFSSQKLKVYFNAEDDKFWIIPSKTIFEIEYPNGIFSWAIQNVDSDPTDDDIIVILEKAYTERELLKMLVGIR